MKQTEIQVKTTRSGLYLITSLIQEQIALKLAPSSSVGLVHLFLLHTSASLLIQENASASARADLETFLNRLVPPNESWYTHTDEGPDDTTAHLKASVTPTALSVPIRDGKLALGVWQGIYLWEHRETPHIRNIILTLIEAGA